MSRRLTAIAVLFFSVCLVAFSGVATADDPPAKGTAKGSAKGTTKGTTKKS